MERILENGEDGTNAAESFKKSEPNDLKDLSDVTNEIRHLIIGNGFEHIKTEANGPTSSEDGDLKIKFQYMEEQAALNLKRPVSYSMLQDYFQRRFRRHLNIYYTTSSREIVIQVRFFSVN